LSEFELPTGCKPVTLLATAIAAISFQSSCLPTSLWNERSAYSSPKPRAADNRQNTAVRNYYIRRRGKFRIEEQFDRHLIVLQIVRRILHLFLCGSRVVQKLGANFEEEGSGGGRKENK
jgi:hypothetical protein